MTHLYELARAAGLQIDWQDAVGAPQRVGDDALRKVLAALDLPAGSDAEIEDSRERLHAAQRDIRFVSADIGERIGLPHGFGAPGEAELRLESGETVPVRIDQDEGGLSILPVDVPGYHDLAQGGGELRIAVAPRRCFSVADAAAGRKLWGPAVQVPSLRHAGHPGFGDFGALAEAARSFAAHGADVLAISPTHALFPADPGRFSPYSPSSRSFLNILFGDPALIGHPPEASGASGGTIGGSTGEFIDWEHAIPARLQALRATFAARSDQVRSAVAAFRARGGQALEQHAVFDALHARFFAEGAGGWQQWPSAYHDPEGAAVAEFAGRHSEEVDFYVFAQWLATASLEAAQKAATDAGMAVGLVSDLAVGMDPGGSHGWSRRDELLTGLSVGAPPDVLGPDGQNWGLTSFSPMALKRTCFEGFIATLRAGLSHAGGIRIDHALGLNRLWVVPQGGTADEGAYLHFPLEDMLRILAIESVRARAVVIGEDLGTIPPGLRDRLEAREVLGMRILWFEREWDGSFIAPERWQRQATAMTGTHDLPTVAGWWRGRDIDWTWRLGRSSRAENEAADREARAHDRARIWQAFEAAGSATGPQPGPDDTDTFADAALAHVGATACELAIVPMEDVLGLVEQPNLPGTIDEHPNWRRRMPGTTDALLAGPRVAARLARLDRSRRGDPVSAQANGEAGGS
ncbi:4-alpha-glucanotransferase [Hoeflea olei]|uniref:4-alpha-glucanotransferase n=1 Tax=Hoeflea olei TaxID=1480615 RepID=A0A1C1YTZ5_9HYPH|nr:4-alpha-glucanotransferase [Hoeflea olei]OCW56974.1 4-alpha-glucanotransferase [Hoeflea olei]